MKWKQFEALDDNGIVEIRKHAKGFDLEWYEKEEDGTLVMLDWILDADLDTWDAAIDMAEAQFDIVVEEIPIDEGGQ